MDTEALLARYRKGEAITGDEYQTLKESGLIPKNEFGIENASARGNRRKGGRGAPEWRRWEASTTQAFGGE